MTKSIRISPCGPPEAKQRLAIAESYLATAEAALLTGGPSSANVAAGNAVHAGIAAADAICCIHLRCLHGGDDHRGAIAHLSRAAPDGDELAISFERLLGVKDTAEYGVSLISANVARNAVRWATRLVRRAREEVER